MKSMSNGHSFANGNGAAGGNSPPGCGCGYELRSVAQESSWTLTLGMLPA
jgi:hypothetical protein